MMFSVFILLLIFGSGTLAIFWSVICYLSVINIKVEKSNDRNMHFIADKEQMNGIVNIGSKIAAGAKSFLKAEYTVMCIFIVVFGVVVFGIVDYLGQLTDVRVWRFYATGAYLIGSITSMICGWIGMSIAVQANYRVTYRALTSLEGAFQTALAAGSVMGFSMIGISLMLMCALMLFYKKQFNPVIPIDDPNSWAV